MTNVFSPMRRERAPISALREFTALATDYASLSSYLTTYNQLMLAQTLSGTSDNNAASETAKAISSVAAASDTSSSTTDTISTDTSSSSTTGSIIDTYA